NLNLDQDDYYYSYAVPTHLAPLVPVALDNSISNEMEVSLYVDENGQLILQYHNIKNSAYEFSYIFASATFPLAVVSIPEVIDPRLGANGKTYPTAGDAVRGQIKQTNEKMSAMKKRITNLEQGIIPSPFETDNTVAYHKDVPENVLPYAEVSMVGGVTRKCTNLIPYPYAEMSAFLNGGNMVANEDGSVSFSGTPTSISYLYLYKGVPLKGTVTLSVSGTFRNMRCFLTLKDKNGSVIYDNSAEPSLTCNLNDYPSATTMEVMFIRSSNNVAISGTCYPMLNEGTTVLPYEPYFSGLRSAPVTEIESVGANLIPFKDQEFTLQGVTFKCKNGALIINGTVSGEISSLNVLFKNNLKFELPAGTYSAKSQGATSSCYIRRYSDNTQFALISKSTREAVFTLEEPTELYVSFYMYNQSFNNEDQQIMLNKGSTALPYKPYREPISFPIPSAVQALDGYGEGNPDNAEEYNAIICENGKWKYIHKGDIEDNAWGSLATTEITDISDILSDDNFIGVEAGGTVTMLNEHEYAVPSEITYQIKGANV
ncbi:MAG: hypothetical protein J6U45_02820, partial [Alistipes sp.]|nr:hypothetical protein [Alistipes sp.]